LPTCEVPDFLTPVFVGIGDGLLLPFEKAFPSLPSLHNKHSQAIFMIGNPAGKNYF
jgi:hypothetical protein